MDNLKLVSELTLATVARQSIGEGESGQEYLVIPEGATVHDFDELRERPRRIRGVSRRFASLKGFADYLTKFGAEDRTVTFCDRSKFAFESVLDYHEAADKPSWCGHAASHVATASVQRAAWEGKAGQRFGQRDMAEWFEDHAEDVKGPELAKIVEAIRSVKVTRRDDSTHTSSSRGDARTTDTLFEVEESIPTQIELSIPLHFRGPVYVVPLRLYAIPSEKSHGNVQFQYTLPTLERILDHAFGEIVAKIPFAVFE